jgi:acetoin utilization protein AcuC
MHWSEEHERNLALDAVEKSIGLIRKTVFPGIIGTYGTTSGE